MNFDKKTNELLSHVMQNHAEKVISILESGDFNQSVLSNVYCCGLRVLPLYKISVCNAIILDDEDWSTRFLPVIRENRKQCRMLLDFWREKYGYDVDSPMDFENYQEACAHFYDWDMEDLLEGGLDKLVGMGYDKNEAELCYAVLTYNVGLLRKHLQLKTNPNVFISGDYLPDEASQLPSECYNALDFCDSVVSDAFAIYGLSSFYESQLPIQVTPRELETFFQAAAYTDLKKKFKLAGYY